MPQYNSQTLNHEQSSAVQNFMVQVYAWMCGGLVVTALAAFWLVQHPQIVTAVLGSTVGLIGVVIVQVALVMALSAMAPKLSPAAATTMFIVYCAVTGLTFSAVFLAYTMSSLASVFAITAGTFGVMSVYGTVTKRDLTSMGHFLFMGVIGIVIASVVNMFLHSSALHWVISVIGVIVFTGLTAYDTQKIRQLAIMGETGTANVGISRHNASIIGALTLYLDFINLFLMLAQLMGDRR